MDRAITRRDFLHGAGTLAAAALGCDLAGPARRGDPAPLPAPEGPASLVGARGSHAGSFEVAHQLAFQSRRDFGPVGEPDAGAYDLLVVGGGVSGLAAAWFYRRRHPDARVLILENHDDFGGHARRNEFRVGGRTLIGYGGSQSIEDPGDYSPAAAQLLRDLGIETSRFHEAYDGRFFQRNGLGTGVYFDRETWGVDRLVPLDLATPLGDEFAPATVPPQESVRRMPLSEAGRRELLRVLDPDPGLFRDGSRLGDSAFLRTLSYEAFVSQHLGARRPEVLRILDAAAVSGFGDSIDHIPAWDGLAWGGLPGVPPALREQVDREFGSEPYIFHFPDGNASVARLLVRSLIPGVAPGDSMEDVVGARFDYTRLDAADSPVRLRLESTVVRVEHDGPPASARRVGATYVRAGRAQRVWARSCVLAGYNMMIPYLCPELPAAQREALALGVKSPLVYTNVALRDWRAWQRAGLGMAYCPGSYHQVAMLDFPVDLGGVRFSRGPDEPIVAHLEACPVERGSGLTPREQYRAGRRAMLATPFESIERRIRRELAGMLGAAGFDPARDIAAITVNRWPHGYAYHPNPLVDGRPEGALPHELGRRPFGRIRIANSDAGGRATLDGAIDEAHRAIQELG